MRTLHDGKTPSKFIGAKLHGAHARVGAKAPGWKERCCREDDRLEKVAGGKVLLYEPVPTLIIAKRRLGSRHILLRVEAHADYDPGQFFQVTKLGYGEAPISIAGYSKEHIDLVINPVGTVTQEVVRMRPGEKLLLRGPFGYGYPMHYFFNNELILVGGGCGVAPLRGVLENALQHAEKFRGIRCFFGYRSPEDEIFAEEMRRLADEKRIDLTVAYSQPPEGFTGKTGYITQYLEASGMDNHGKIALICGPTPMMLSAVQSFKKLGFNDDQVWISHERHMKCATGMCGHCMIEGKYTCKDGPVFRWDWIKDAKG